MADEEKPEQQAAYPPPNIPALAVDGVTNMFYGPGVMKFYMVRSDPEIFGKQGAPPVMMPVVQVVVPTELFPHMAIFFERTLENLVKQGKVSAEAVRALREQMDKLDPPQNVDAKPKG